MFRHLVYKCSCVAMGVLQPCGSTYLQHMVPIYFVEHKQHMVPIYFVDR